MPGSAQSVLQSVNPWVHKDGDRERKDRKLKKILHLFELQSPGEREGEICPADVEAHVGGGTVRCVFWVAALVPLQGLPRLDEVAKQGAWGGGNVSAPMGHITVGKLVVGLLLGFFIIVQVLESILHARGVVEGERSHHHTGLQMWDNPSQLGDKASPRIYCR